MTARNEIIEQARELDPEADFETFGLGRFDGASDKPLTLALDIIVGHGFADAEYGSVEDGLYVARVEKFLYSQNDQGFIDSADHETPEDADRWAEHITTTP